MSTETRCLGREARFALRNPTCWNSMWTFLHALQVVTFTNWDIKFRPWRTRKHFVTRRVWELGLGRCCSCGPWEVWPPSSVFIPTGQKKQLNWSGSSNNTAQWGSQDQVFLKKWTWQFVFEPDPLRSFFLPFFMFFFLYFFLHVFLSLFCYFFLSFLGPVRYESLPSSPTEWTYLRPGPQLVSWPVVQIWKSYPIPPILPDPVGSRSSLVLKTSRSSCKSSVFVWHNSSKRRSSSCRVL